MAHEHMIYDSDEHFVIDPISRAITNATSKKISLMQYDHNSERFSFEIPKIVESHDMTLCDHIRIHFVNTSSNGRNTSGDMYDVTDFAISDEDENMVIFTWLIPHTATEYAGSLKFQVKFICVNENNEAVYRWSTDVNDTITIKAGMDLDGSDY